jgi:hypothetical protein
MATPKRKGFVQQIRDQKFYIEVCFYNQIEGQEPISIPFFYIDSLKIVESLQHWATTAELTLNTDFEIFARGTTQKVVTDNGKIDKIAAPYIDRTDGRNRISVRIYPISPNNDENVFPKYRWEMSFDFVVVDVEDLPTQNSQRKKRKYILVDERYQILKERNIEWSTRIMAAATYSKLPYELTDEESSMNPNDVLREIINLAASNPDPSVGINDPIKVGYSEEGSIDKPTIPLNNFNSDLWDIGSVSNKLQANNVAKTFALDDLESILPFCTGTDGYPVILDFGRSSVDKAWHLISLKKLFQMSNEEQVERLLIEDGLSPSDSEPYVARADASESNNVKNFTSGLASRISKYKFSPMVATDDNKILNKAVHFYNHTTGEFSILMEQNTAKSVLEGFKEIAQNGLYSFKNGYSPQIISNLNQTKAKGLMTTNELSLSGPFIPENSARNEMLLDFLFLSQSVTFQALGLTLRAPGKFIFIDRIASADSNPFDDRFLGQWLMTKVSHLFTQETYVNEVVAVKVDSFGKLFPEEDNKF